MFLKKAQISSEILFLFVNRELLKSVECIDRYSRLCMYHTQRAHFHHLYSGIAKVVQDLCQDGDYREEFLKHAPCMSEVTEEHEVCSRIHLQKIAEMQGRSAARHARHSHHENEHSDQPHHHDEYPHHNVHHRQHHQHHQQMTNSTSEEAEEIKTVCCSFHDYLRCSHRGVAAKCGEETGSFANDFMTQMASKVIKVIICVGTVNFLTYLGSRENLVSCLTHYRPVMPFGNRQKYLRILTVQYCHYL